MPELPEVETIAKGVNDRVRGSRIVGVWTSGAPQTFKSAPMEIERVLTGRAIEGVRRGGKTIVVTVVGERPRSEKPRPEKPRPQRPRSESPDLGHPDLWRGEFLVHLGMTGRLLVADAEVPKPLHTHAVLTLEDGREVRFVDPRRFGRLSVAAIAAESAGYGGPGVEPTTIGAAEFAGLFAGRKLAIKAALLNQSLLHGVG